VGSLRIDQIFEEAPYTVTAAARDGHFRPKITNFGRVGGACLLSFLLGLLLIHVPNVRASTAPARDRAAAPEGFTIDLTASEADVLKAVQSVVEDQEIHGTFMYEREPRLTGAAAEKSSSYFGDWGGEGHVFYKVRRNALAPRHFKNSADIGVITVRYVVRGVLENRTHLQITAVFVEDGTKHLHVSDTSVETSEFAEIQSHLVTIQREEQQEAEILQKRQLDDEAAKISKERNEEATRVQSVDTSLKGLEQRAQQLQHTLEVRVINPSTDLKSAPFHSATSVGTLTAGSDVLVEIITEYWYGVETTDGHRGWLRRDQVEQLP
jgi:hypothetical protein